MPQNISYLVLIFFTSQLSLAATAPARIQLGLKDILGAPVAHREAFLSDEIQVRVEGLPPQAQITLRMEMGANRSEAVFVADAVGVVDSAKQAPLSGDYQGVDTDGLIWSMRPFNSVRRGLDLHLEVLDAAGNILSQTDLARPFPALGVQSQFITTHGFIGQVFLPPGKGPFPAIIVLGGGEGGLGGSSYLAAYFASHGYAALAVAYFGLAGLPSGVDRIPMEYFKTAIDWVKEQPFAKGQRLGISGGSRGGEGVLAVASTYDVFSAVGSDLGNALPLSGYDLTTGEEISPWTYQGRDLPFQKNLLFGQETFRMHAGGLKTFEFKSTRRWEILNDPKAIELARLPVERIHAPILFNTADDDALWPSTPLSKVAFTARAALVVGAQDEFYSYPNVGHVVGSPPGMPAPETYIEMPGDDFKYWELGGTPQTNARARRESMRRTLLFFEKHLR